MAVSMTCVPLEIEIGIGIVVEGLAGRSDFNFDSDTDFL